VLPAKKEASNSVGMVDVYLLGIYDEAVKRKFNFNRNKINSVCSRKMITVTDGQLEYETKHLKRKLERRNHAFYIKIAKIVILKPHPLFRVIGGTVEAWEKITL